MVGYYAAGHSDYLLAYGYIPKAYRLDVNLTSHNFSLSLDLHDPRNCLVYLLHAAYLLLFVVISVLHEIN